jgi:hypothetical protein
MDKTKGKDSLLEESQISERDGKFMVMGSRREGGQMTPVKFVVAEEAANTYAEALVETGWATAEVYTRVAVHKRK